MGGGTKTQTKQAGPSPAPEAPARAPAGLAEAMADTPLGRTAQTIRDSPVVQARAAATRAAFGAALDPPAGGPAWLAAAAANSPLARTARMIRDSPVMQARAAALRAAYGPALDPPPPVQRAAAPPTGLPGGLKAEVEARSGLAMDDVRVHRDSPEPAQVQALATARGTDIHLAPGQEQHLPHEAWHVVQQKQGRVAPTLAVNGVAVNDDPALEREADAMGAAAPGPAPDGAAGADGTVQRRVELIKPETRWGILEDDLEEVNDVAKALDDEVEKAVGILKVNPNLVDVDKQPDGYLARWVKIFKSRDKSNPIPDFLFAAYGYAVETLATLSMNKMSFAPLKVSAQVDKGGSRPDFIVYEQGKEVGWLDVTSEGSVNHVDKKKHSGWKRRPYVAEILYPSLDVDKLGEGGILSDEQKAMLIEIKAAKDVDDRDYDNGLHNLTIAIEAALEEALDLQFVAKPSLSATSTRNVVIRVLKVYLGKQPTVSLAGEILRCIETMEVRGEKSTGERWAYHGGFGKKAGTVAGRKAIREYGATLSKGPSGEKKEGADIDMK